MNTLTQPGVDQLNRKYYQNVPEESLQPFISFRIQHPFKTVTINNTLWEYLDIGEGQEVVLLLTGVLGVPIMDWRHISHFSEKYHIIAVCYPAVSAMTVLVDGIAEILHIEGISNAHVWGGSYGGAVAQVFARRHPALTKNLIISHSFPPNHESAGRLRKMYRWMRLLPGFVLKWVLHLSLNRLIPEDEDVEGLSLTRGIFNELMHTVMNRKNIIAILNRTIDFSEMVFTPQDLDFWPGAILLIMTEDDPSTPTETRKAFEKLYPGAKTHLFFGTGHATSLIQEEAYRTVIESFLQNQE